MAARHIRRRPRAHAPARPSFITVALNYLSYLLLFAVCSITIYLAWPLAVAQFHGTAAQEQRTPAPTLAPAARQQLQQQAPATSSEQQAVNQAVPTENASAPPLLPAAATAAVVNQPQVERADAAQYSPVDLGWAPLPTPTTMLSQEQYDASQASEEQQFIDNAAQGLTEAQKLVRIHEAEQAAKGQP